MVHVRGIFVDVQFVHRLIIVIIVLIEHSLRWLFLLTLQVVYKVAFILIWVWKFLCFLINSTFQLLNWVYCLLILVLNPIRSFHSRAFHGNFGLWREFLFVMLFDEFILYYLLLKVFLIVFNLNRSGSIGMLRLRNSFCLAEAAVNV